MKLWQLQEAKNKFSEVVEQAVEKGPQVVTRRGREIVAIISIDEYRRLISPPTDIVDFFQESPLAQSGVDLDRRKDISREVDL